MVLIKRTDELIDYYVPVAFNLFSRYFEMIKNYYFVYLYLLYHNPNIHVFCICNNNVMFYIFDYYSQKALLVDTFSSVHSCFLLGKEENKNNGMFRL